MTSFKFPILERFAVTHSTYFYSSVRVDTDKIFQFIANSSKLKSILLYGSRFHSEAYKNMSLQLCKEKDIFMSFGTFTSEICSIMVGADTSTCEKFQNEFEKNIEPITKMKYDGLKDKYLTWTAMNEWWKWALK